MAVLRSRKRRSLWFVVSVASWTKNIDVGDDDYIWGGGGGRLIYGVKGWFASVMYMHEVQVEVQVEAYRHGFACNDESRVAHIAREASWLHAPINSNKTHEHACSCPVGLGMSLWLASLTPEAARDVENNATSWIRCISSVIQHMVKATSLILPCTS